MRRKKQREEVKINTSSLPDIVFMLLMFFMLVGKVPAPLAKFEVEVPVLEAGEELKETSRYIQVHVGSVEGVLTVQIGYDEPIPLTQFAEALEDHKEPGRDIVVLRVDGKIGIGILRNEVEPLILESGIKYVKYQLEDEDEEV